MAFIPEDKLLEIRDMARIEAKMQGGHCPPASDYCGPRSTAAQG